MPSKKNKLQLPRTDYVRGRDLLDGKVSGNNIGRYGEIPLIIHQTWKSEMMKPKLLEWFDGWKEKHPECLHVLWLDEDNERLVKEHFPEFQTCWDALTLIIQKTDIARLMYLYKYGGVYADMDYECFMNVFPFLPRQNGFMVVESDMPHNEVTQNSFMISVPSHPSVMKVLEFIKRLIEEIYVDKTNKLYNLMLNNVFTAPILKLYLVTQTTGPSAMDRALVRTSFDKKEARPDLSLLNSNLFMKGTVAKHNYTFSWSSPVYINLVLLIVSIVVVLIVIAVVVTAVCVRR